jgi:hypothetical protein
MERSVEDNEVELSRLERQGVEIGLDGRERNRVVAARPKTIGLVFEAIDGDDSMTVSGKVM